MNILFLCVANSARSQMAQGLARKLFGDKASIESAGSAPTIVNPLAIEAMKELGIDITDQSSKSIDELDLTKFEKIITLCADEVCPVVNSPVEKSHWPFPDPAGRSGSHEEQLSHFRTVRDSIQQKLEEEFKSSL